MEITGSIIAVLPERTGTSSKGEWKCATYVLETQEQYPKKMCFDVFGADKIAQFNIKQGEYLTVSFDINAHEYQGKYFNSIRAWNVARPQAAPQPQGQIQQPIQQQAAPTPQQPQAPFPPTQPTQQVATPDGNDDLPF